MRLKRDEIEENGIANDIFQLKLLTNPNPQSSKVKSKETKEKEQPDSKKLGSTALMHLPIEQCVMNAFAQTDALLQDIIKMICTKEPRVLVSGKQITWKDVIEAEDKSALVNQMISKYQYEFGYMSIRKKIDHLQDQLGLDLGASEQVKRAINSWEQCRHAFTHTGGYVTKEILDNLENSDFVLGQRIIIGYSDCVGITEGLLELGYRTAFTAESKFWKKETEQENAIESEK